MSTQENKYRVMSFDPSSTQMGMCMGVYYVSQNKFLVLHTETIKGDNLIKDAEETLKQYKRPFIVQHYLKDLLINEIFPEWAPDFIVSEGAFYCSRMPNSFEALILIINAIQEAAFNWNKMKVNLIAPSIIKREVSGKANASKDEMKEAVLSHPNIDLKMCQLNNTQPTEHEYDAIAHGYTFCQLKWKEKSKNETKKV